MSTPGKGASNTGGLEAVSSDAAVGPNFSAIISTAQQRSSERTRELRRRAEAIAKEQQRRWNCGIEFLNANVRPMLERALQACVEEGLPAKLEDNFAEKAATPRLFFYCSSPPAEQNGCRVLGAESDRLVLESDGELVRAGIAKCFSTSPDAMRICEDVDEIVTTHFSAVLESYFKSCEHAQRYLGT